MTALTSDDEQEINEFNKSEHSRAFMTLVGKIPLLYDHYELNTLEDNQSRLLLLCILLAQEFVPGFHVKNLTYEAARGRKQAWGPIKYAELLGDVHSIQREKNCSDSEACLALTKSPRFKERWGKINKRTLENRLLMARMPEKNPLYTFCKANEEMSFLDSLSRHFGITENRR